MVNFMQGEFDLEDLLEYSEIWSKKIIKSHVNLYINEYSYNIAIYDNKIVSEGIILKNKKPTVIIKGEIINEKNIYSINFLIGNIFYYDILGVTKALFEKIIEKFVYESYSKTLNSTGEFISYNYNNYLNKYYEKFEAGMKGSIRKSVDIFRINKYFEAEYVTKSSVIALYRYKQSLGDFKKVKLSNNPIKLNLGDIVLRNSNRLVLESIKPEGYGQLHYWFSRNAPYSKSLYKLLLECKELHEIYIISNKYINGDNINTFSYKTFKDKLTIIDNRLLGKLVLSEKNFKNHINFKHKEISKDIILEILNKIQSIYKIKKSSTVKYIESCIKDKEYQLIIDKNKIVTGFELSDDFIRNGKYNIKIYDRFTELGHDELELFNEDLEKE